MPQVHTNIQSFNALSVRTLVVTKFGASATVLKTEVRAYLHDKHCYAAHEQDDLAPRSLEDPNGTLNIKMGLCSRYPTRSVQKPQDLPTLPGPRTQESELPQRPGETEPGPSFDPSRDL